MQHRHLGGGSFEVDYTVLAMVSATLVLLLLFELMRHYIDHSAKGKPFAQAVLSTVYSELTTLGSVEAFIFILIRYHKDLSIEHEQVFASVHFTLFFVAIFNTLQTITLALLVKRESHRMWVQTEDLEISHYVSIRKKFQKLDDRLQAYGYKHDNLSEEHFSFRRVCTYFREMIFHPNLRNQHHKLLVQIRYHEMRLHMIESNNLHPKFPVSAYLKECELDVLKSLLHISPTSWLIFMTTVITMYFICGLIHTSTNGSDIAGTVMGGIFVGSCVAFVFICILLLEKMKAVYYHMVHTKKYDIGNEETEEQFDQLELFWGHNPHHIITALQLMQFGYSICFAILLVWSQIINVDHSKIDWLLFVFTPIICYMIFLQIAVVVLPRYTLCTSLGQLVRHNCLSDVLSMFELKEENHKRERYIESLLSESKARLKDNVPNKVENVPTVLTTVPKENQGENKKSEVVIPDGSGIEETESDCSSTRNAKEISKLVRASINEILTLEAPISKKEADSRKQRRARMRSLSDGVSAMRLFSNSSEAASSVLRQVDDTFINENMEETMSTKSAKPKTRPRRQRFRSLSANVSLMRIPDEDATDDNTKKEDSDEKEKIVETNTALPSLIEDIPVRAVHHLEIPVLIGRGEPEKASNNTLSFSDKLEMIETPPIIDAKEDLNGSKIGLLTNSANSEDGHSVGDLPEFVISSALHTRSFTEKIIANIRSEEFQDWGVIVLTLLNCYIVAMRVEVLGMDSNTFPDLSNTWHLKGDLLFWLEVSLLLVIIIFELFVSTPFFANVDLPTIMSGLFDIVLTSVCLGLLLWAENERCSSNTISSSNNNYNECADFGSRSTGGIGIIEPFTFLISLRFLKYDIGNLFRRKERIIEQNVSEDKDNPQLDSSILNTKDELSMFSGSDEEIRPALSNQSGTVNDLWKIALQVFPDIAKKYGKFSSELFQAMLFGSDKVIPMIKQQPTSLQVDVGTSDFDDTNNQNHNDSNWSISDGMDNNHKGDDSVVSARSLPKGFDNLNSDAQGVILNGKFGECSQQEHGRFRSVRTSSWNAGGSSNSLSLVPLAPPTMMKMNSPTATTTNHLHLNSLNTTFLFADSNLIRSMRRCERQFLPLFDEWETVDVVMTRHEIVWFSITNDDEEEEGIFWDNDDTTNTNTNMVATTETKDCHKQSILDALISTNGGKGLRLSDVAYGRNVLGSLKISDIDNIKLKRFLYPKTESVESTTTMDVGGVGELGSSSVLSVGHDLEHGELFGDEYWRPQPQQQQQHEHRWDQRNEERLVLHSTVNNCTLNLRFVVDLANDYCAACKNNNSSSVRRVEGAGLWCPTIARLCGPYQLKKQKCLHLGEGSEEELADFLEIHHMGGNSGKKASRLKRTLSHMFEKRDLQSLENAGGDDTAMNRSTHTLKFSLHRN